jgi:hypothetical protein
MHHRNRSGYALYPLFLSLLFLAPALRAQTNPPATSDAQSTASQEQQQPLTQLPAQTPEERARVLREAQSRVRARRRQRDAQIVQDTYSHKYELAFGGSYLRFRPGKDVQHNSEAGWDINITDYIRPRLGVVADFRGYYGTVYTGPNPYQVFEPSVSQYTAMFGPQYRFLGRMRWSISGQVLAGIGHGNFGTGTGGISPTSLGMWPDGTVLNVSASVPIDYNLGPGLALRVQPSYLMTNYGSTIENNLGFTAGMVYRFGRQ